MIQKQGVYYPDKNFQTKAWVNSEEIYRKAKKDPVKFWEDLANDIFWRKKWNKSFEHNPPYFNWFAGGKINLTENIFEKNRLGLDKIKDKTAIMRIPEPVSEKPLLLTYSKLLLKVNKLANALKKKEAKKGDRAAIYLPMIPEVIISILACARIGAIHSVVFSAFSAQFLKARLDDTGAKILITADGYWRRGYVVELKKSASKGIKNTNVKNVIVVRRLGNDILWDENKDCWFDEIIKDELEIYEAETMDSEETLFILYTSGSTGKPKGILHTCGGYTVQIYWTGKLIFDIKEDDIFWCTSDVGWITGYAYTFYSPLLNGISTLIFEGVLDWPDQNRRVDIIEKYKVTKFYTAPTAIRMFQKYGAQILQKYSFYSLRLLGFVGEPIDESAWLWYFKNMGKERCSILDTWWQTETGGILIISLPGIGPFKPAFAGLPFPGVKVDILDEEGKQCKANERGNLVILPPFTSGLTRRIYNNDAKYKEIYWSKYADKIYFTSDSALRDKKGLIRILGRVDDVLKVAGHRLSTGELEDAINKLEEVSESAVAGIPYTIKVEVPAVFASYSVKEKTQDDKIRSLIINKIKEEIDPIAIPQEIYLVDDLPKTRSGKIMRRILKNILLGEKLGNLSTLSNPDSVKK